MTTIYASGRQTLSQDDWSITKTATEGELTGKTLYFSLQTKNNSGYNIPIVSSPIVINTNDKLTVTLEDTIRKEGEGWLYAVICCGLTNDPAEMNQVAKIPLFGVDQFGYPNIDDPVTYPITIDFSYDHQLSVGELLDEVIDLPSANLINGIRYAVVEKDNNIYELDINSVAEVDDDVVLDAAIGRWILTSSFSNDVTDVTLAGGCNVNLLYLNDFSTVELPTYDVNGAASPKMQYWIVNDTGVDIEAGRSITLNVDAGGYDKSKLFDNKIAYIFHGFANVTTGELRTTYDESGENLLYINLENDYSANYPTVTIEDTLKNGEALFFSLFVKFDLLEVQGKLPNTTLSIFPELIKTSGTFNPLGTLFEKGIITKELNRLRVYPDEGLAVKVKSGSGIVRNYNFWKPLEQSVIGLTPNATNKIYVDKDGDVYLDTVENNDSVLRAIAKTLPIESKASDWSAYTAITLDSRLEVTVVYPCNADLIATIRANYPDVIAGTASYFNVRKINVYVQRQSDNEIRKFTNIFATPVANQVITISDWSSGTVVTELPTTEQGLFNPVTVTVANLPTGGNMTATNYRVAYSLVYDGTVVSDIDHSSSNGCITEVQLTAEDLFGTISFNTLEEVRNITTLYDGRLIYCKQTNSGYFYNTTSNESDDGHDFIEPNVGDGCWINVRRDVVSKHLSTNDPTVNDDANDDFLNGDLWLNTTNDKCYICVDNTVNNAIWKRLIYATDLATVATSGSYADLSNKPTLGSAAALDAGSANGVCPLDGSGKVDSSYLPSYVDDVVEYADLASLPVTGEAGKIYITLNTNRTYRWSGSSYVEISNPFSGSYNDLGDKPTLGTAAALDVGTSANNVVQLDNTGKLPAVDGSQLTGIVTGSSGHIIVDESTSLTARSKLTFKGTGVTATDNSGADSTDVTINLPTTGSGLNLGTWDNAGTFTTGVRFDGASDKVILPQATTAQRTAITPLASELIYDTDLDQFFYGDGTTSGGKTVGSTTVADNVFRIQDNTDATKQIAFEASGITTATTRTITVPDSSGTIALIDTTGLSDKDLFYYDSSSKLFKRIAIGTTDQVLVAKPSLSPPYQWATSTGGGREVLTADRTYYVRTDGSDSNNGLTDTAGGAFLTIQKAIDTITTLDGNGYNVTVSVADGTYTTPITSKPFVGVASFTLQGNTTTPANVVISITNSTAITLNSNNIEWYIKGFKITTTTSGSCISVMTSRLKFDSLDFGSSVYAHLLLASFANVSINGSYSISGGTSGANRHIAMFGKCNLTTIGNGHTVTITNTPAFDYYLLCDRNSFANYSGFTFSGSATGSRYSASMYSVIYTNGQATTWLPGSTAGSLSNSLYA